MRSATDLLDELNAVDESARIEAKRATDSNGDAVSLRSTWDQWQTDGRAFWQQMDALVETLDGLVAQEAADA